VAADVSAARLEGAVAWISGYLLGGQRRSNPFVFSVISMIKDKFDSPASSLTACRSAKPSSKDEGVKVDGSVEKITLTPVRDGKTKSTRGYETRIKAFGLAVVLAVLALSGGLVWWAFS
jgi:hypothetical protein